MSPPVYCEVEVTERTAFVAVTAKRSDDPASAAVGVYVAPVAPAIATQLPPATSQRSHWRENETWCVPRQAPKLPLSGRPAPTVPLIAGREAIEGGTTACHFSQSVAPSTVSW